jgi:hypothetical protein
MGILRRFICRLGSTHNSFRLRLAVPTAVVCALLLIPVAQAAADEVSVEKTGPGAASSTVISEPMGIDCGSECSFAFGIDATVRLTAVPGAGYVLGGWTVTPESEKCPNGSLANPCEVSSGGFFSGPKVEASFVVAPPPPTASTGESSEVDPHSATLEGIINPENSEVNKCYFEYGRSTGYGLKAPCTPASLRPGISAVRVTAALAGLAAETTYHYRLVAVGLGGNVKGEDRSFTTEPAPPAVSTAAPEYTQTLAHLRDLVNPERSLTTYFFRFGTTSSYGQIVPVTAASAGSGEAPVSISQIVTGLTPGVIYHYRLVATNAHGTTTGPDQTFAALTALPDNRAYEMVTPPFKSFGGVTEAPAGLAETSTKTISSDGSPLLEDSTPFLGTGTIGADEESTGTYYALQRGVSEWTTTPLTPPASVFPISHEELASAADAAVGLWAAATLSQSIYDEDFYLREADGNFVNIGPIAPPATTQGPPHGTDTQSEGELHNDRIVGASADLSDVVFQLYSPGLEGEQHESELWPGDETVTGGSSSLYEYVGSGHSGEGSDVPSLVGVDNSGAQISQCGTGLGANGGKEPAVVPHGISDGGSTVFFNASPGGCMGANFEGSEVTGTGPVASGLYARIGTPGAPQVTVNVAGSSECATSVSCNVTSPVTYQGASSDGSKVFFTTEQALLPSDNDTTNDIYECELPGDSGATLPPAGVVNACPNLKAVSVTGTSSGANVQSVVAVSEEGSRVYFTATGVLSSAPDPSLPSGHRLATEGEDNLYVWEAGGAGDPAGHIAFVATLSRPSPEQAQATPDGRYLVFTTTADLTSDDKSTVTQVFRYDAQSGELVRVSAGQDGFNNDGNTYENAAKLANTEPGTGRMTISEDGSDVVFQSNEALTPQVQSGSTRNVYEWHEGNVYLISDGKNSSGLIGIDASGADIFFVTPDELVPQDTDEDVDVYDARVNGGFPEPTPTPSCSGEACQGAPTTPLAPSSPGSTGAPAVGNLIPSLVVTPKKTTVKSLTRAQKLAMALTQCRKDKSKSKRKGCEASAKAKYGSKAKPKHK